MPKRINMSGQYGRWLIDDYAGESRWHCTCTCPRGTRRKVSGWCLRSGQSRSCGCLWKERSQAGTLKLIDLAGKRFGDWLVDHYVGAAKWRCVCRRCGTHHDVKGWTLRTGRSKRCSDCRVSLLIKRNTKHGLSKTGAYASWEHMKQRVGNPNNPAFERYSKLGYAPEYHFFIPLYADLGDRPAGYSIDRIDNSQGYFPHNVRWADRKTQRQNQGPRRTRAAIAKARQRTEQSLPPLDDPPF